MNILVAEHGSWSCYDVGRHCIDGYRNLSIDIHIMTLLYCCFMGGPEMKSIVGPMLLSIAVVSTIAYRLYRRCK